VSPLQATIIQYFGDQGEWVVPHTIDVLVSHGLLFGLDTWNVEALAAQLEISDDLLLRHATYWLNNSVLALSSDRKELVAATLFDDSRLDADGTTAFADEQDTAVSSQAQADEDVHFLESYIVGMLANLGSLSIQHIHNTLSTYARSGVQPCKLSAMERIWR
jgi:hypothetical protein